MRTVVADIETDGLLDTFTTIWCLGIGDPETEEVDVYSDYDPNALPLAEGLQRLRESDRIVFHNGLGFDFWVINSLHPGTLRFDQIWDTLVVSRLLHPTGSHSLETWGERLGFPKGKHEDWSRWSPEMSEYLKQDVRVGARVYKRLHAESRGWGQSLACEHKVAFVLAQQQAHGFRLNLDLCRELEVELRQEMVDIEREVQRTFRPIWIPAKGSWDFKARTWTKVDVSTPKVGNINGKGDTVKGAPFTKVKLQAFNPGSRAQIAQRLSAIRGWRPTKFTDAGAPAVDEDVLSDLRFPEAEPLKRYFAVSKMLGQVADGDNAWLKLEKNGRVHGYVNPCGARTNRMTHAKPNMAQVSKKDKRMRQVWQADEGQKLVGCDAEGLELRMLGHYLALHDGGAYSRAVVEGRKEDETDVHNVTRKAVGLWLRDSAKTFI